MGWFSKNKEQKNIEEGTPSLPELPQLPRLPELPPEPSQDKKPLQLPRFPSSNIGQKFSQDTIKEAVAGKKEGEGVIKADDFVEKKRMMPKPPKTEIIREYKPVQELGKKQIPEAVTPVKKIEPIFIRVDKFEESLGIFEKAKEKISEIEKMLREIRELRSEEERELNSWEKEMITIKGHIEKIDQELFSKLE